jgi:23S rRNA-/tRNA-specific pseudouridylate synthase
MTQKTPLIPIDDAPVEILYESPSILVARKPMGMPAHPMTADGRGTLLNRLFQHGRWLAEMEECPDAGVLHVLNDNDHGLSVYIKDDKYAEDLRRKHANGEYRFYYLLRTTSTLSDESITQSGLTLLGEVSAGDEKLYDLEAKTGDTQLIRDELRLKAEDGSFYCYAIDIDLPHLGKMERFEVRSRAEKLPKITIFTAPP